MIVSEKPKSLVSIVMPAYQAETTIEKTLFSIIEQSYSNWELLLIIDAATDRTYSLAKEMAAGDKRIRLIYSMKNRGVIRTRNIAIRLAKGRFLAFCDADDWWVADKLENQLKLLDDTKTNFCYTSARYVRLDQNWTSAPARMPSHLNRKRLLKGNPIGMSTVLMDTNALGKHYFFNLPEPYVHEDYAYFLRLFESPNIMAVYLPQPTTLVSISRSTRSGNKLTAFRSQYYILRHIGGCSVLIAATHMLSYVFLALYKRGLITAVKQHV
jgi:teichuronic acid biosynthesis glycosyltransferase TuaG